MILNLGFVVLLIIGAHAAPKREQEKQTQDCHGKPAELYFLLDSSTSIWPVNFTKQLNFVKDVIDIFEVSPTHTRVGVGSFSDRFKENFSIRKYDNKDDVKTAVSKISQLFGNTYTFDALDGVRTKGLDKAIVRPDVVRIAIVITDGESFDGEKTEEAAGLLKDDGVTVFAVGIGRKTNKEELKAIASDPSDQFVFNVGNFDLLQSIREKLAMSACAVELQDAPMPGPACGAENAADVMFVADSSRYNAANMIDIFDFIADVSEDFNTETDNIRIGIQTKGCGSGNLKLGRYNDKMDLFESVMTTKHSAMHHLLKRLGTSAYKEEHGGRNHARHMAVVFVDETFDDSTELTDILEQAHIAKKQDVEIFVVAVGDNLNDKELKKICSQDADRHYIKVNSYDDLRISKSDFLDKFCHDSLLQTDGVFQNAVTAAFTSCSYGILEGRRRNAAATQIESL